MGLLVTPVVYASQKETKIKKEDSGIELFAFNIKTILNGSSSSKNVSLEDSESYKTFLAVQAIKKIAANIQRDLGKKYVSIFWGACDYVPNINEKNKFEETMKGLAVAIGHLPCELMTPWGEKILFLSPWLKDSKFLIATQLFFEKMKLKFVGSSPISEFVCMENVCYFEMTCDKKTGQVNKRKLTKKEYDSAIQTGKIVVSNHPYVRTVYEVVSVEGIELPRLKLMTKRYKRRTAQEISNEFKQFEKCYQDEEWKKTKLALLKLSNTKVSSSSDLKINAIVFENQLRQRKNDGKLVDKNKIFSSNSSNEEKKQ